MNKKQLPVTSMGWGAIISMVALAVQQLTDGDPSTQPDWNLIIPNLFLAAGVIFSRAKKATSEDVGAKDNPGGP